ncbi:MAG: hypothetical protein ACP5IL_17205, partial [Syntrophobacteraceae bacterium]
MIEKPTHGEGSRSLPSKKSGAGGNYSIFGRWRALKLIILAALLLIALLALGSEWIQMGLWMRQLGYTGVFWT